ncbi:MAG: L-threonylcarbamoyladenylate synthase, partial [Pseudomonadota bacterium]
KLAEHYWPGPMTLILKKQTPVLDSVTGRQDTVGIRIPNHPVAQQLLKAFGGGLAAPSANSFGYISPTSAKHVREDLGDKIDMILDGGHCGVGIESTIIDCSGDAPRILRPGIMDNIRLDPNLRWGDTIAKAPRVSGALDSHYAPRTLTRLLSAQSIDEMLKKPETKNIVVLSSRKPTARHVKIYDARVPHHKSYIDPSINSWIIMPSDSHAYAHRLYEQLHFADSLQCHEIWIEEVPNSSEWSGILDRITKASCR